jgi:tryptophan synthase alpha chain
VKLLLRFPAIPEIFAWQCEQASVYNPAMTRIELLFKSQTQQPKLIAYICALDPDFDTSLAICKCLIEAGVDLIELGVPFSDPLADGRTNQLAAERALAAGATPCKVLDLVRSIRQTSEIPLVLYTYFNLVYNRGIESYVKEAKTAGVDGVLVLDLPPEEASEMVSCCKQESMDRIFLVAPTTPEARVPKIVTDASGFLYYVSREGVTGERADVANDLAERVGMIRKHTHLPIGVGFGISNASQVRQVAQHADAVIVGSAIVRMIGELGKSPEQLLPQLREKILELRSGLVA